ncbi:MAG: MFS transporter [Anaerolineales bacterium]|nr:MFS transporter [Anaerolineales bacterium]
MANKLLNRVVQPWQEFPRHFQILMGASFIDRLGGALLFPFFGLYVTEKFGVGMIEVGIAFAIWAVTSQIGSVIGGALADKIGRKTMVVFGLVISAASAIAMGVITDLTLFYLAVAIAGTLGDIGQPAQQAMVADLLPEGKRSQGYGVWRVVANLAVMIGPLIGGWMANSSYLYLFITDAITSTITAAIVMATLPETKPETTEDKPEEGLLKTFSGYLKVFKNLIFVEFIIASILVNTVYVQMNSTLPVFLRDVHNTPPSTYGIILSINAGMVVVFQFWLTRKMTSIPPMIMMVLGTFFYLVGFGMYGFVGGFLMFALAMVILTIGEMILIPVAQALVAQFAPEDMRGRYMAVYGIGWSIPFAIGPYLAGVVMEKIDPNWVWYGSMMVSFLAILGFLRMHMSVGKTLRNPMIEEKNSQ